MTKTHNINYTQHLAAKFEILARKRRKILQDGFPWVVTMDYVSYSGWPFVKIKLRKTENETFAEFKYLERNQLYGKHHTAT